MIKKYLNDHVALLTAQMDYTNLSLSSVLYGMRHGIEHYNLSCHIGEFCCLQGRLLTKVPKVMYDDEYEKHAAMTFAG